MRKIILILLLFTSIDSLSQSKGFMMKGDTLLYVRDINDTVQISRNVPPMAGQSGKVLSNNGTIFQWVAMSGGAPTFLNLANAFSSTSTSPAAVTGWSFAVASGTTYRIEVIADYQTAATTTGGIIGISLSGGATGSVRGFAKGSISASAVATELAIPIRATSGAGSTLTTTAVSAQNTPHFIHLLVTFTCSGSGTFNIVWGSEVNASAAQLNQNSTLTYQALN